MLAELILGTTRFKKGVFSCFVTFDVVHMNTQILYLGQPLAAACTDTDLCCNASAYQMKTSSGISYNGNRQMNIVKY
jgi:hypothetical protein